MFYRIYFSLLTFLIVYIHFSLACNKGYKYELVNGHENCTPCPIGEYNDSPGQTSCKLCPNGYSCPSLATINPSICKEGTFSNRITSTCDDCSKGFAGRIGLASYSDKPGQHGDCLICPQGYYCPDSKTIKKCPLNTYNLGIGRKQCSNCGCGFYTLTEGSLVCLTCPLGSTCAGYGTNIETVSTTILKEVGYNRPQVEYDAVAWVIYNRMKNPKCGGSGTNQFPTNPKDNVLRKGEFEPNKDFYGENCVPKSQLFLKNGVDMTKVSSFPKDYGYTTQLSSKLEMNMPPSTVDPTDNRILFYQDHAKISKDGVYQDIRIAYPNGVAIGGNWFYDTAGSISCLNKQTG